MLEKIFYLCDGEKEDCEKTHCYKAVDDGFCRHTTDVSHALNFVKEEHGGHISYQEKVAAAKKVPRRESRV